jgi:hypothetical protein
MNPLLAFVAEKIWEQLQPWLEAKWKEVKPQILAFVKDQFEEWMPKIVKAIVVAISQSAGQLVVNTADKVTDVIPGQVDDIVVDTIVDRVRDAAGRLGINF